MPTATERLEEILRTEARAADQTEQGEGERLRRLASTTDSMTPGEKAWVEAATDAELRSFARSIRLGCAPAGPGDGVSD
jgi:hypothetical protein